MVVGARSLICFLETHLRACLNRPAIFITVKFPTYTVHVLFDILFTQLFLLASLWAISLFLGGVLGTVCLLSYDYLLDMV